uniref:Uncharacterized protein n=1 Tax=Takifugu rubripes TaxID=31033 RepID=A0A674MM31_TAKRU
MQNLRFKWEESESAHGWRPWLSMLSPFAPPVDPYHVTLFYDRENNEVYQDAFREKLQGNFGMITSPCLFVGPEGVAASDNGTHFKNKDLQEVEKALGKGRKNESNTEKQNWQYMCSQWNEMDTGASDSLDVSKKLC